MVGLDTGRRLAGQLLKEFTKEGKVKCVRESEMININLFMYGFVWRTFESIDGRTNGVYIEAQHKHKTIEIETSELVREGAKRGQILVKQV